MSGSTKKVVVMGGGTGTFTVLSGLRKYDDLELSAIVAMTDDGGSTGRLRDELGVLPPGDVRQGLVALSDPSSKLRELMDYRFGGGTLEGHNFGNLFLSALEGVTGSFETAVAHLGKILNIRGNVYPVTYDNVVLEARRADESVVTGQHNIAETDFSGDSKLPEISITPLPIPNRNAIGAIYSADLVVIGPGDLFCSVVPTLVVPGIRGALRLSHAKKLYVCNLMSKRGHCTGFSVGDYLRVIKHYVDSPVHAVLYNNTPPSAELLSRYAREGDAFVKQTIDCDLTERTQCIGRNLVSDAPYIQHRADKIQRTLIRHDSEKLGEILHDIAIGRFELR